MGLHVVRGVLVLYQVGGLQNGLYKPLRVPWLKGKHLNNNTNIEMVSICSPPSTYYNRLTHLSKESIHCRTRCYSKEFAVPYQPDPPPLSQLPQSHYSKSTTNSPKLPVMERHGRHAQPLQRGLPPPPTPAWDP